MNTNCLSGIRCPSCGSEEEFRIVAEVLVTVVDDGVIDYSETEWSDDSTITCAACDFIASVADFSTEEV